MQCGAVVPRIGAGQIKGIDSIMSGRAMPNIQQTRSVGRSCGFANMRFGFTGFGDNRFFAGVYQKRVTGYNQKGRIPGRPRNAYYVRMKSYRPTNPNTPLQVACRAMFANSISSWSLLTESQKNVYNKRGIKRSLPGRNLYISEYMKSRRK